ncbi:50S ribosomal protein L18 [Candidatus Woesearchaeota archaeon]|nr:50S ribosomal protein L18 [Candidatus Woesearchaeota archaeon]
MKRSYTVGMRRKREGKTNYKKRLKLLKCVLPRLVVRKSLNNMQLQIAVFEEKGDKILAAAHSRELEQFGWHANNGNVAAAYLAGVLMGAKAVQQGIKEAVLDIGLQKSVRGSRIYAALKGCIDGGLKVPVNPEIFPSEDRIKGAHIGKFAQEMLSKDSSSYHFALYKKKNIDMKSLPQMAEETKKKILGATHGRTKAK